MTTQNVFCVCYDVWQNSTWVLSFTLDVCQQFWSGLSGMFYSRSLHLFTLRNISVTVVCCFLSPFSFLPDLHSLSFSALLFAFRLSLASLRTSMVTLTQMCIGSSFVFIKREIKSWPSFIGANEDKWSLFTMYACSCQKSESFSDVHLSLARIDLWGWFTKRKKCRPWLYSWSIMASGALYLINQSHMLILKISKCKNWTFYDTFWDNAVWHHIWPKGFYCIWVNKNRNNYSIFV